MNIVTIPEPYRQAVSRDGATVLLGPGEYADGDQNNYLGKNATVR